MKKILLAVLFITTLHEQAFAKIQQISSGWTHTCAIADNKAYCWGAVDNDDWHVNMGQANVPLLEAPYFITASSLTYTCAIDALGIKCWGDQPYSTATNPPPINSPQKVEIGLDIICAQGGSDVKCWGSGPIDPYLSLNDIKDFSTSETVSCAIYKNNEIKCWGYYNVKELWENIPTVNNPEKIALAPTHACVIDSGELKCWGQNFAGQLNIPPLKNVKSVSVGSLNTCAIDDDGIKCWGSDSYGQISHIPPIKNPKMISVGVMHVCASDGEKITCWGCTDNERTKVPDFLLYK